MSKKLTAILIAVIVAACFYISWLFNYSKNAVIKETKYEDNIFNVLEGIPEGHMIIQRYHYNTEAFAIVRLGDLPNVKAYVKEDSNVVYIDFHDRSKALVISTRLEAIDENGVTNYNL